MSPHCSDVWSALRSSVQSLSGAVFYAGDQISPMLRLPTQVKIQNQAVSPALLIQEQVNCIYLQTLKWPKINCPLSCPAVTQQKS